MKFLKKLNLAKNDPLTCSFFKHTDQFSRPEVDNLGNSTLSNQEMWVINVKTNSFKHIFDLLVAFIVTI